MDKPSVPIEFVIREKLPGDSPEVRALRSALIGLFHSGDRVEWSLESIKENLVYFLSDPVNSVFDAILLEEADLLSKRISVLGQSLVEMAQAVSLARDKWREKK